ncbi:MAG: hypothetical protein AAFQ45_03045 [Pseudomonadota bacterium]
MARFVRYAGVLVWVCIGIGLVYAAVTLGDGSDLTPEQQAARSDLDRTLPYLLFGGGAIAAFAYAAYIYFARQMYGAPGYGSAAGTQAVPAAPGSVSGSAADFQPEAMPSGFEADFDDKLLKLSGFGIEVTDRTDGATVRPGTPAAAALAAEVWRSIEWFRQVFDNAGHDRAPPGDILLVVNGDSERFAATNILTLPGDSGYDAGVYAQMARDLFGFAGLASEAEATETPAGDDRRKLNWQVKGQSGEVEIDTAGKVTDMAGPAAIARAIKDVTGGATRLAVIQEDFNIRVVKLGETRLQALADFFADQDVYWLDG